MQAKISFFLALLCFFFLFSSPSTAKSFKKPSKPTPKNPLLTKEYIDLTQLVNDTPITVCPFHPPTTPIASPLPSTLQNAFSALETQLESYIASAGIPGIAATVVYDGDIIWSTGLGLFLFFFPLSLFFSFFFSLFLSSFHSNNLLFQVLSISLRPITLQQSIPYSESVA